MAFQLISCKGSRKPDGSLGLLLIFGMIEITEKVICRELNLPYEFLDHYIEKLPKSRRYILYCSHGGASMLAGRRMSEQGLMF